MAFAAELGALTEELVEALTQSSAQVGVSLISWFATGLTVP